MNLIDDFSSYIWSLPLRNKAEATLVLQHWHKHVTTQFDRPLKILVTNNGELMSNTMMSWCLSNGINHLVTAPYMSAQNGHAERVHWMILRKARAMWLACNAPPSL
jgi:transposase InsO family protein